MNGDSLAICVFPPNRDLAEAVCMNGEIPLPYVCFPLAALDCTLTRARCIPGGDCTGLWTPKSMGSLQSRP